MEPGRFTANKFEHSLTYNRKNGQHVELVLTHLPGSTPVFRFAIFEVAQEEPIAFSKELDELDLEEVKMRYRFYKWLEEAGLLN